MNKENILVVEDEEDILELVSYNLSKEGYDINSVSSGEEALEVLKKKIPDLVVLDLMLPGIDGLEVCKLLKNNHKTDRVPVIMLTAKGEEEDIVKGLETGADDYITKPFSPKVLSARIKTVLKRKNEKSTENKAVVKIHGIEINPKRHEVLIDNKPLELTYTEFKVLYYLASQPGWVFTRYQIIDAIKGDEYDVTDRSVDVLIVGLRKKLGLNSKCIETVRGVGYRFKE